MKTKPNPGLKSAAATTRPASEIDDLSRHVAVESVPDHGLEMSIHADAEECAALAQRCGLVSVASLGADFRVTKTGRTRFTVTGILRARVTQTCVVSLEPFETEIETDIDVDFASVEIAARSPSARATSKSISAPAAPPPIQPDAPDPIIDGRIDLGALAAEFLVLSLDPYPRKPGTRFEASGIAADPERVSPFAALKKLEEKL